MAVSAGLEGGHLREWFHTLTLGGPELGIPSVRGLWGPAGQHELTGLLRYSRRAGSCLCLVSHTSSLGVLLSQEDERPQ